MQVRLNLGAILIASAALAASGRSAAATPGAEVLGSEAPIRCFRAASNDDGLSSGSAVQLCAGATSDAPASCVAAARDRVLTISDADAIRLCTRATSMRPAECVSRLDATTTLSMRRIVTYCAASHWKLVPARSAGTPECVDRALERTDLSDTRAVQLCRGARSAAPVACFERGDDETTLTDAKLVALCRPLVPRSIYPLPPADTKPIGPRRSAAPGEPVVRDPAGPRSWPPSTGRW